MRGGIKSLESGSTPHPRPLNWDVFYLLENFEELKQMLKKTGRPAFHPTKMQREKVMLLVSTGMENILIAAALGISRPTLVKCFHDEIQTGRARKMAENLGRLEKAAKAGNVAAMKHLDMKQTLVPERRPEPLGKKETLNLEAKTAHAKTEWGDILN